MEGCVLLLCCPGSPVGQGLCRGGNAEEAVGAHCRWRCVCRVQDADTRGSAEAVGYKVWAGCVKQGGGRCVRSEEMELQCMGSERCARAEWSHLHGEREMWLEMLLLGLECSGLDIYICKVGCGAGGARVQGEVWLFSAGRGCTCSMLCGVRNVCV